MAELFYEQEFYNEQVERDAVYCDYCGNHHWPLCYDNQQQDELEEEIGEEE